MSTVAPPRPSVDPRLRARRVAVAREAGRRRLHRLVVLGSALGFLLVVAGISRSPFIAVHHVDITGQQHTTEAELSTAIGSIHGQPIYSIDTGAVRRRLEALPWVASASVSRHWPQSVRIRIVERVPKAGAVGQDGLYRLVDGQGRVLAAVDRLPPDMVELVGPEPAGAPGSAMSANASGALAVAVALPPSLAGKVSQVEWMTDGQIRLGLNPYGRVLFGSPITIPEKLLALDTMLRSVPPGTIGEIDVRAPEAPVMHEADPSFARAAGSAASTGGP